MLLNSSWKKIFLYFALKRTTYTNRWSKTWILIVHDIELEIHEFVRNVQREVSITSLITTWLCILRNRACIFSLIFATTVVELTIFNLHQGKSPSNFIKLAWNNFLNTNTATITGKYKTLFLEWKWSDWKEISYIHIHR